MGHPCLFCERQVKLSDEHILPQWLLKSLGVHESQLGMTHHSTVGLPVSRRGPLPFANFINGRVCADCNNGWMSQLEADMKPQLEALMNLDLAALKGLESARDSLTRWTLKTAAVLNHATNYRQLVPLDHFHALFASEIPDHVHVGLSFTEDEGPVRFRQSQHILALGDAQVLAAALSSAYRVSFQFRHLLLRAVFLPVQDAWLEDDALYLWPQFGMPESFRLFEDIDDFDVSGVFTLAGP